MKTRIITESGTEYMLEGRKVTRTGPIGMRHDEEPLEATFWGVPEVGARMTMFLRGEMFDGGFTTRETTPVVSIEVIEE